MAKQLFTEEEFSEWMNSPLSELKLRMDSFDFELQEQVWNKLLAHACFDRNDDFAIARLRMIRDYRTGASILVGDNYGKSKYAGTMFYWTTKPDGQTIEDYECYVGMYPGRDPRELYSGDIATVDKLEVEVEFHVDKAYHEDWVKQYCQSKANSFFNEGKNFHGWSTTHPQTETQT